LPGIHNSHPLTLQSGTHQPLASALYPGAHTQVLPYAKPYPFVLGRVNIPPSVPGASSLHSSQHVPT
jgi:hypothetical protein